MTNNDGWGTPWPATPTPAPTPWPAHPDQTSPMTVGPEIWMEAAQAAPWPEFVARNYDDDGLGNLTAKREYVEGPDAWPVNPEDSGEDEPRDMMDEPEFGTYGATDDERARAINACIPLPSETPWVVDVPDGELTLKEDYIPTVTENEATGFYVAYSQGILHCILAGPYTTVLEANVTKDRAWERFQADGAMALAFAKSGWNPSGLYVAEIPLKARRRGAYGLI